MRKDNSEYQIVINLLKHKTKAGKICTAEAPQHTSSLEMSLVDSTTKQAEAKIRVWWWPCHTCHMKAYPRSLKIVRVKVQSWEEDIVEKPVVKKNKTQRRLDSFREQLTQKKKRGRPKKT